MPRPPYSNIHLSSDSVGDDERSAWELHGHKFWPAPMNGFAGKKVEVRLWTSRRLHGKPSWSCNAVGCVLSGVFLVTSHVHSPQANFLAHDRRDAESRIMIWIMCAGAPTLWCATLQNWPNLTSPHQHLCYCQLSTQPCRFCEFFLGGILQKLIMFQPKSEQRGLGSLHAISMKQELETQGSCLLRRCSLNIVTVYVSALHECQLYLPCQSYTAISLTHVKSNNAFWASIADTYTAETIQRVMMSDILYDCSPTCHQGNSVRL